MKKINKRIIVSSVLCMMIGIQSVVLGGDVAAIFSAIGSTVVAAYITGYISNRVTQNRFASSFNPEDVKNINLKDCTGIDIKQVNTLIDQIRNPGKYKRIGLSPTKGILLVGEAGTGKTRLARAIAGELSSPFYAIKASQLNQPFVGVAEQHIRELFASARQNAATHESKTAIIFIDEIDVVGTRSVSTYHGNHNSAILNALLTEMDGFDEKGSSEDVKELPFYKRYYNNLKKWFFGRSQNVRDVNIVVIAATNCPQNIDVALKRSGRFDDQIEINLPDEKAREQIINYYLKKFQVSSNIKSAMIAKLTDGNSPADIKVIFDNAARRAVEKGRNRISGSDMCYALFNKDRIITSQEKNSKLEELKFKFQLSIDKKTFHKITEDMTTRECICLLNIFEKYGKNNNIVNFKQDKIAEAVAVVEVQRMKRDITIFNAFASQNQSKLLGQELQKNKIITRDQLLVTLEK